MVPNKGIEEISRWAGGRRGIYRYGTPLSIFFVGVGFWGGLVGTDNSKTAPPYLPPLLSLFQREGQGNFHYNLFS